MDQPSGPGFLKGRGRPSLALSGVRKISLKRKRKMAKENGKGAVKCKSPAPGGKACLQP
jgi:hypothetical protein